MHFFFHQGKYLMAKVGKRKYWEYDYCQMQHEKFLKATLF